MMATPIGRMLLLEGRQFSPSDIPNLALWLDASRSGSVLTGGAAQCVSANSEYLSIADNASLSTGDVDCWGCAWVYRDTGASTMTIMAKYTSSVLASSEYLLDWSNGTNRFRFVADGSSESLVSASTFGNSSTATWYFVMWYHDAVNNLIGISVNGGAFDTAAHSAGLNDSTAIFSIGVRATLDNFFNGCISNVAFGKSPVGGIAAKAATIRDTLYNGGNGVDLRTIDAVTKTAWGAVSAWPCNEISGTRSDVWAVLNDNSLSDNNTVGAADGPYLYAAQNNDPIRQWRDLSSGANHATQATGTLKPLYKTAIVNGRSVIRPDGVDDVLALPNFVSAFTQGTIIAVIKATADPSVGSGSGQWAWGQDNQDCHYPFTDGVLYESFGTTVRKSWNPTPNLAAWNVYSVTSAPSDWAAYLNGVVTFSTGTNTVAFTSAPILFTNKSNIPFKGDVAALLVYNRALSSGELNKIHRYFGSQYAIVVA